MQDTRDHVEQLSESGHPPAIPAGYHGHDRWLLLLAALIGVLGGLATVVFHEGMAFTEKVFTGHPGGLVAAAEALAPWRRALTPALGGFVAGAILWLGRRVAKGKKQSDYLEAIAIGDGRQEVRGTLLRSASSLCTIASGGSIGREGAMVQLAAATGSWIGQLSRVRADQLRLLLACGAAAGFASAYDAALSGAIFIAEVVYGTLLIRTLGPLMVASVTANVTVHQVLGYQPVYQIPPLHVTSLWDLPLFLAMGLLLGALAPPFMELLDGSRRLANRLPVGLPLKLALGGLVVGGISVLRPEVWGNGYSVVNEVLHTPWPVLLVLSVLIAKIVATTATAASGAVGGVFTPTIFVGAMLGLIAGDLVHALWPGSSLPTVYAVIGMGTFLAATTHAPLMSFLIIFEMTLEYQLVPALMLACLAAYHVSRAIRPHSIYYNVLHRGTAIEEEVTNFDSPSSSKSSG
ncbi:MAG: ClcB-like voltage-gated chloride channel protein [Verrucomicrobia bacterium]|nr:ClcB-like voltage-gated chloride channel protein [Verrucomicrobiota bacterium]